MAFPDIVQRMSTLGSCPNNPLAICPTAVFHQCSPVRAAWDPHSSSLRTPSNSNALGLGFSVRTQNARRVGGLQLTNASKRTPIVTPPAEEEEEVEVSWVEEKVEDVVQYTRAAVKAIPGPRVADGELPWLLAVPAGYVAISLAIALFKTVRKRRSPKGKRLRQVGKNASLVAELGELLPDEREQLDSKKLKQIGKKLGFGVDEVLRKYVRYALNERPFDPVLVTDLIHLRKVSMLEDTSVAEVLNEVARRIVKAKGPVIVDTTGFTEKGLKRKVAVQALFSKLLYLAELEEFCGGPNQPSSLNIKEIFGVTDEDANLIRIETLSGETDVELLEEQMESLTDEDLDKES